MDEQASPDIGLRISLEYKFGSDTEVLTCAAEGPEKIRIFCGSRRDDFSRGYDNSYGEKIVDDKSMFISKPAVSTAKGKAPNLMLLLEVCFVRLQGVWISRQYDVRYLRPSPDRGR